jgi:hypothetical protein
VQRARDSGADASGGAGDEHGVARKRRMGLIRHGLQL